MQAGAAFDILEPGGKLHVLMGGGLIILLFYEAHLKYVVDHTEQEYEHFCENKIRQTCIA